MKIISLVVFITALIFFTTTRVSAQVDVNINLLPQWGPAEYDHVEYYYMPEHDIYYYAPKKQFVYRKGNVWTQSNTLPYQYRNVNLYSTYKVVINEPKPYDRHTYFADKYKGYKKSHPKQSLIRDSHDPKYGKRDDHQDNKKYSKPSQQNSKNIQHQSNDNMNDHNNGNAKNKGNGKGKKN